MSSKYSIGRPTQEVRLRNWPAGRVAQFRKAVELLETQLNETMAAQVDQGERRVVSTSVPKIINLSVRSGFKNFQLNFDAAKGIKDLLFYEIQKSGTANFAESISYKIPQTSLTVPTQTERESVYFRVRCINSKFMVGPWSASVHATGSSNFRIAITRTAPSEVLIASDEHDTWMDVGGLTFNATAAQVSLHLHAGVHAIVQNKFDGTNGSAIVYTADVSVVMRILKDGIPLGGQMNVHARSSNERATAPLTFVKLENVVTGSLVTPFEAFTGEEGSVVYTVQAKVLSETFLYTLVGANSTLQTFNDDVGIAIAAIDLLEIIQST